MHPGRHIRGAVCALALLLPGVALAIEVPLASCNAVGFACGNFPPAYGGPSPADWDGAAPLECARYSAAHRVGTGFCPCGEAICSEVVSCSLDSRGPQPGFVGQQGGRGLVSGTRRDTFTGETTDFANIPLDCLCPAGARLATLHSGICSCSSGQIWDGTQCISPTSCTSPRSRFLDMCIPAINPGKNNGKEDCNKKNPCLVGNPIDVGSGIKTQAEPILKTPTLSLTLVYNSHVVGAPFPLRPFPFGQNWTFDFGMRVLSSFEAGAVAVTRPRGQVYQFLPPPSGSTYVSDSDVADRLERLLDGSGAFAGWRYTTANGDVAEQYDTAGNLVTVATRSGQVTSLEYSTAATPPSIALKPGLLIKVSDHFGRQLDFTYDYRSRIVTMADAGGGLYTFAYEGPTAIVLSGNAPASNLTSVTFPGGAQRIYHYNEQTLTASTNLPDSLTGITDENGERFATFQYDAQGRAQASQHGSGALLHFVTYGAGTSSVTDPLGATRDYGVQVVHGVAKIPSITGPACPNCGPASQTFDANGNVQSRTDWNGNRTNYTSYDLARNLELSRTEGLTAAGAATTATRTIETQWHATYRLPTQITEKDSAGAVLRTTSMSHDAAGNVLTRTVTAGPKSRTWTYTYNANGSVLTANGPRTDVSDVTTYSYYANDNPDPGKRGNVETITNAAGHVTSITEYNAHGQPLTIVDPNGLVTSLGYDSRQRLTSRTVGTEITSYDYDGVGNLDKVTLPDGSFLDYTYDTAHRLTQIADNLGNRIDYTPLDAMGNRTQERVYDPSNTLAQRRTRVYDNQNHLFREIGAQDQTTEYGYDNQGNLTLVNGPLAGAVDVTTNAYDALNRLRQVTDPGSGITQYGYNALDQLVSVTDPRNLATNYTYNGLGDLDQLVSPDTGTTVNSYDPAGNLLTQTDAKGQTTSYVYDVLNRVTLITFHDGSKQAYVYDQGANGLGRLSSITERDPANQVTSLIAYAYDAHGRVTAETRTVAGVAYALGYSYDSAGRLSGLTYPSGRTVTYAFDGLGRISQVATTKDNQPQVVVQNVAYHPFGGVKGYTLGNGQSYSRSVDLDGRIASYTLGAKTYNVGYDAASRIESIKEAGNPANENIYRYDALDRLISAALPSTNYGYSYDAVGNRLTKLTGASTDTYAYAPTSNRLASVTPASGPVKNFSFDPNGSTVADGLNTYAYDVRGRLVQATSSLGVTSYQVNALGQRIRKTNNLGDRVFHYDTRGRLIAETDPGGGVKREVIYLGDIPVGVAQ